MKFKIDESWTLFLDRDGVINDKIENNYVKNWSEFSFINETLEALSILARLFGKIIVVTNQRGVGKGVMLEDELKIIHTKMLDIISKNSGRIDKVYYCIDVLESSQCRKPNIGMALNAKIDFPEIDFNKSIMIGDSKSDIEFGKRLGMKSILISKELRCTNRNLNDQLNIYRSLKDFTNALIGNN